MSNLERLIEIKTRILIHDERDKENESIQQLKDLGIYNEEEDSNDEVYIEKDVTYMFDPTLGIHEIRETYIPYKDEYEKVIVVTFSEGYIQTPPLFIELKDLKNKIKEAEKLWKN